MANEKGVWRTIGGRRVFIKEGQDLASAMKESGKFKSAKKFSKREELKKDIAHQVTEAEKNGNTAHAEIGKRELERLNSEEKEQAVKDYENGKISAEDVLNKFYGQEDKMKEAFEKMGYTAPTKENIDRANANARQRAEERKKATEGANASSQEKVLEDFKNSDGSKENFEKALNKISEMEYNNEINPDEYKDYISKIQKEYVEKNRKANSDREALRNTEKEYGELSKKMQADDYYYKPEDDRKLKELRAKADSERARQGIDTQEKYDKLMSEENKRMTKEDAYRQAAKELGYKRHTSDEKQNREIYERAQEIIKEHPEITEYENAKTDAWKQAAKELGYKTHTSDEKAYRETYERTQEILKNKDSKTSNKEKTWRDKIKDTNTRNEILDKELDESTKSKTKEFWSKEDSNGTDLNTFNDKAKASFGKIDYYGNGRKSNEVEIEMQLKDGVFTASGSIKNARGTDSISGGQNIDEIADMMKGNKDVQEIRDLWHKYHLNDMHAGTEKQEEALEKKFGGVNANKYDEQVAYLKSIDLYEDNGYRFGSGWLKREIPDDDKRAR